MIGFKSITGWEDSKFGGYRNLLIDYPTIQVDWKIHWDLPTPLIEKRGDISSYTGDKLVKLFLLKIKEFNLIDNFTYNLTKETEEQKEARKGFFHWEPKGRERYYINSQEAKNVLEVVIAQEEELKNLFIHYRDVVQNTRFYMNVDPEDKKDEKDEKNEGQKGNDEDKQIKVIQSFKDLLKDISKQEFKRFHSYYNESIGGELVKNTKFITMPAGGTPCWYTSEETLAANRLVNLLDISFESKPDVIKNLRAGKLDTSKLAEVASGTTTVYYKVEEDQTTRPFSLCFLMDESGSMQGNGFLGKQKSLMKILYKAFSQIVPLDKMFIYGHTGNDTPDIHVYHDKYNPNFEETINRQDAVKFLQNYDGPVIEAIYNKIRTMTSDNIIFISLSDGEPGGNNYGGEPAIRALKRIIEKCKRDGFVTIGVGMCYGQMGRIYNYNTIIHDMSGDEIVKKVSLLVNKVVKTEFQS